MPFFKAYDMRGEFGADFDLDTVHRVGRWLPHTLPARRFLVGRDARSTSPAIRDALCRGLSESGAAVDDMGLASTPMVYFATAEGPYDASVQITASHNPPSHNGMKVSRAGALPVGRETGLAELEARVASGALPPPAPSPGPLRSVSPRPAFIRWLKTRGLSFPSLRFAVDCSDGMAALVARDLFPGAILLNDRPDGRFPHHSPNPLDPESRRQAAALVTERSLDCALVFDGDADRVVFLDERGRFVPPDCLIPVIARRFLAAEPGAAVIHDVRTSRGAIEALRRDGARPVMGRVGHAYAKLLLRETGAVCGGELAGHYYFRDFHCCDSACLAAMTVLDAADAAKSRGAPFSALLAPILRYANSGELNFRVSDTPAAIAAATAAAAAWGTPTGKEDMDGIRLEFPDGWVNIRPSNTEPCLRLIAEAADPETLAQRVAGLRRALAPFLTHPAKGA